jgi:hypothetical protein
MRVEKSYFEKLRKTLSKKIFECIATTRTCLFDDEEIKWWIKDVCWVFSKKWIKWACFDCWTKIRELLFCFDNVFFDRVLLQILESTTEDIPRSKMKFSSSRLTWMISLNELCYLIHFRVIKRGGCCAVLRTYLLSFSFFFLSLYPWDWEYETDQHDLIRHWLRD